MRIEIVPVVPSSYSKKSKSTSVSGIAKVNDLDIAVDLDHNKKNFKQNDTHQFHEKSEEGQKDSLPDESFIKNETPSSLHVVA